MEKIKGIKSVDFKIKAVGEGVVNWNGSTRLNALIKGKYVPVNNHSLPKLRGFKNQVTRTKEGGDTFESYLCAEEIDFTKTPLYISQNCIRHHLFKGENFNLQDPEVAKNMEKLLCSITGLMRGYVIPKKEYKRTSALLITDFNATEETAKNGNFEQMSTSGSKEKTKNKAGVEKSNSMFSKTTFGETEYGAYASISIEQLQFISLDDQFSRQTMEVNKENEAKEVASQISKFIQNLGGNENAEAVYHTNYVRKGSIFTNEKHGEEGILLNDDAIDVLIEQMKYLLENLSIRQAKGYMYVDSIEMDYNDSVLAKDMFRIKRNGSTEGSKKTAYAVYFEGL
ncbi:MAG: hypothetical protein HFP81_05550 [Methylococcales symbiont of Hymedesmia sp. n. MRB-2018]|nr:MAG: hypothetical protein HFP81_05550 [Methylococcales symbiont of Hymedesmia sp. n. MRB-2018]